MTHEEFEASWLETLRDKAADPAFGLGSQLSGLQISLDR